MSSDIAEKGATLKRFKAMTPLQHVEIIEGAVDAVLHCLVEFEAGRKASDDALAGQLAALQEALKDHAEPVTELTWEKLFRPTVAKRLDEATVGDAKRYKNAPSRDVMVNLIKVATMGLTLARHEKAFEPSAEASRNLKKYALEVRPKLQAALDPETHQPRLRTIDHKKPRTLPKGKLYWLIGCETDQGIAGANTVVAADANLDSLRHRAQLIADKFKSYLYIEAPQDAPVLDLSPETEKPLAIQNAAVFASTL